MAFKDVYNFKQVVLKEMESMGYDRPYIENNPRPSKSGATDSDFSDWTKHYMYRYYRDFFLNTNDLGTVVLNKNDIITFYNANLNRISDITNGNINFDTWESNDFLPYLELVSFPVLNEDKSVKYAGMDITNEKPGSDYVLCYHDLQSPWPLVQKGEDDRLSVDIYARYGRGNNGFRGGGIGIGSMNVATLCQSRINLQDIDADNKWLSLKTTMQAYDLEDWITLTPVNPDNDWRGAFIQNGQWLYKGKTPVREKDTFREYYFYRKFEYRNNDGVLLGYRYIPLTPFLSQQYAGNTATSSNVRPWGGGFYSDTQYPCFGFQPFNHNIIFDIGNDPNYTYDYMFSLPGLTYTQSESMNVLAVNVDSDILQHGYTQLFMRYFEIWQYLYLCEIRFETNETKASILPYSELMEGIPPTIDSGGGGEGETAGPGGTTSGGNKEELSGVGGSVSEDTVIRKYPVQEHNLVPGFYGGVYIPTYRYIMEITDNNAENDLKVEEMNRIINNAVRYGKGDSIVESFITYSGFINSTGIDEITGEAYDYRYFLPGIDVKIQRPKYLCGYDSADRNTYIPKNNKLLTYPYVSFEINGYGERNELKYENWSTEQPRVFICSKFLPGSCIFVFPENYEGVRYNYDAGVASQPLPILPYTIDKFKNEYNATINSRTAAVTSLTETSISNGIYSVLGGAAGIGAAAGRTTKSINPVGEQGPLPLNQATKYSMTGSMAGGIAKSAVDGGQGLTGALMSYHQGMREFEAQLRDVENRPLAIANQNAAPSLPALNSNSAAPYIVWKSIRKEFAQKIDDFFTRYGYKVSKYKEVDIHTRPVYNFLKCNQARVEGSIPNEDLMQIKTILEKGITFWHDPSKILDYSVDNPAPKKDAPVYLNPSYNK